MSKITYLASVSDGKISFPSGVLDSTMLSTEVNNTSSNDTIPTSKAVYDSIVKFTPKSITEQDGVVTITSDKYLVLPQVNQITNSNNYLQQGWYYQHFDISGLGTNEEIISGTKNTVIFWLSDSTKQIVEDIQNPTYIPGFNSGFQVGWWLTGVNDGRFPSNENCHFEIIQIDANKITVKLYAIATRALWWVNGWLRNGKVDLGGSLSKDDYTVYCNGATAATFSEKLEQTRCGGVTLSNSSLLVGDANFFGSNNNITCGNFNYTTIGNTLTVGAGLINSTYSGTVLGSYNEPNGGLLQVGGGSGDSDRKTLFSIHSSDDGKIKLNAPTEVYKDVNIKNSNNENTVAILAESGDIYVNSNLGSNALKDNASDKVIVARKSDGGLYKSNVTTQELSNVAGTTYPIQTQINNLSTDVGNKAGKDASNLSSDNVTSWKEKLDIDALEAEIDTKATKATTLNGYGITDAYTKTQVDAKVDDKQDKTDNALTTNDKTIVGAINEVNNSLIENTNELGLTQILKQNCGQLYLNGGYGFTNCKPTFGTAQSLMFTYEVSETELYASPWSIIGNLHIWSSQKGIGFAKNTSNKIQCGFNWSGNTTGRAFIETNTTFADGKPHTWALVCGKNATNGFFKLYCDGVLIGSRTNLDLFEDFIPTYGFYLGKSQASSAADASANGRLSRIAFFNFDVSESNALYSLADYQAGKSIPPSLLDATEGNRAILNLENYTIARNTTTRLIKDLSAGGYDATVTGAINGDMDRRVEVFVDELKTQIEQSTATTTE